MDRRLRLWRGEVRKLSPCSNDCGAWIRPGDRGVYYCETAPVKKMWCPNCAAVVSKEKIDVAVAGV